MGWINQGQLRHPRSNSPGPVHSDFKGSGKGKSKGEGEDDSATSVIEDPDFPFYSKSIPDRDLPFILADVVVQHTGKLPAILWIVVDEVVYDCSTWADEHPGGDSVIRGFGGQDCSWQFWRFHNRDHMARYGVGLRVGRTKGVENRFLEPKRYSRLRGFDAEDW